MKVVFSTILIVFFSEICWLKLLGVDPKSGLLRSGKLEEFQGETWKKNVGAKCMKSNTAGMDRALFICESKQDVCMWGCCTGHSLDQVNELVLPGV